MPLADIMDTGERANHGNVQAVREHDAYRRSGHPAARHPASRAFEVGDRISGRSQATGDSSAWPLTSSPGIEDGTELPEHLHRLLDDLEPVTAQLWDLVHAGYKANWFCYIASHATEHAAELDRQTLQRLLALPGDLWLDVCGETGHDGVS
jgi:hypothetical protein